MKANAHCIILTFIACLETLFMRYNLFLQKLSQEAPKGMDVINIQNGKVFKTKVQVLCGLVEEQLSGLVEVTSVLTFVVFDYDDLVKIPYFSDAGGEVANQLVHMPLILPKVPGRFYYYFGKPLETEGVVNLKLLFSRLKRSWK
ncbi:hypothetical protein JHK87_049704 [Glycine soja]|nr:hypothetical protein JHK87_049704 [Glycine soja]